ncbi:MAG: DUF1080 domain-containing protein [Armatimonadetes bacterium]|nr:DUF1080 domain-containing protein [Armatimonadota bacterium]
MILRPLPVTAVVSSLLVVAVLALAPFRQDRWVSIFDGKTLDGWTPKIVGQELGEDPYGTFRVEDGKIVVRYDKYEGPFNGRFGHLFYKTEYSNYRMRLEYRFVGDQVKGGPGWAFKNSGIMIHGQRASSMGLDQSFPVSIEVQLLGGSGSGDRPTGNLCTPGTHVVMAGKLHTRHCTNSSSPTFHGEEWVRAEIEVRGNKLVRHMINGVVVLEYGAPQYDPGDKEAQKLIIDGQLMLSGGTISLQSESHPIEFRKIEIMVLD